MFKFIHCADIHIDSPFKGLQGYDGAPVDMIKNATRRAFENLVNLAIEESVKFVLIAGDLYDGDCKSYSTALFLARQFGKLKDEGIRVFIVKGNHDAQSAITKELNFPDNVYYFPNKKPGTKLLHELHIAIHGQGYSKSAMTENLAATFPEPEMGMLNIGLLHSNVGGRPDHDPYAPCTIDQLRNKGYAYWALGHIHKREFIEEDPWIIYPGNIQGRHMRETGEKGCVLVSVKDNEIEYVNLHTLDVMRWARCSVDATDIDTPDKIVESVYKAMKDEMERNEGLPLAIRITVTGSSEAHDELIRNLDQWKNQIFERAFDIDSDALWVERVEFKTKSRLDFEKLMAGDGPIPWLLKAIDVLEGDKEALKLLVEDVSSDILQKIPQDLRNGHNQADFTDPGQYSEILQDVKELLVSELRRSGGGE